MKRGKCRLNIAIAMEEVMRGRVAEAIELKERYDFLQNAIKAESALKNTWNHVMRRTERIL